jgi:transposase-like protein
VESQKWLKAGIALGNDPKALVVCPACGEANLEVIDAHAGGRLDRYIHCPNCKKYNVLTNVAPRKKPSTKES